MKEWATEGMNNGARVCVTKWRNNWTREWTSERVPERLSKRVNE